MENRALNAMTERDRYPLLLIREKLRMVSRAKWPTKVDVRSVFHRLCIADGDEWKNSLAYAFRSLRMTGNTFWVGRGAGGFPKMD